MPTMAMSSAPLQPTTYDRQIAQLPSPTLALAPMPHPPLGQEPNLALAILVQIRQFKAVTNLALAHYLLRLVTLGPVT